MKKILRAAAALILAGCMMTTGALAAPAFSDVPNDQGINWYVLQAAEKGLASGMGDGSFGMGKSVKNSEFVTMICNLMCKDEVAAYAKEHSMQWPWGYMAVAYTKGYLKNTAVGDARIANNAWSTASVNANINRYDMAQIMINVAQIEGWSMPSTEDVLEAQLKIADWKYIPGKYQTAVATAYAKGFLSGMQDGTFSGGTAMLREHSAVVLCKLMDARDAGATEEPSVTETLSNGKAANEENVKALMEEFLTGDYAVGQVWENTDSYTSSNFKNEAVYGNEAFVYQLSDHVFGELTAVEVYDFNDLRAGDVLYYGDWEEYMIITKVGTLSFDYVGVYQQEIYEGTLQYGRLSDNDCAYTRYPA